MHEREIERKFLISDPCLLPLPTSITAIQQGYMYPNVRVRIETGSGVLKSFLFLKFDTKNNAMADCLDRDEFHFIIDNNEATNIFHNHCDIKLSKIRQKIFDRHHSWDVDFFRP